MKPLSLLLFALCLSSNTTIKSEHAALNMFEEFEELLKHNPDLTHDEIQLMLEAIAQQDSVLDTKG